MAKDTITLDTPEIAKHDDIECSTVDVSAISYLDINLSPSEATLVDDSMPSDTEADIIQYYSDNNSMTRDDTNVVCGPRPRDVDDSRVKHDILLKMTSNLTLQNGSHNQGGAGLILV